MQSVLMKNWFDISLVEASHSASELISIYILKICELK